MSTKAILNLKYGRNIVFNPDKSRGYHTFGYGKSLRYDAGNYEYHGIYGMVKS